MAGDVVASLSVDTGEDLDLHVKCKLPFVSAGALVAYTDVTSSDSSPGLPCLDCVCP